jgi:drug/metabolite transporter (DMT)-like permease
VAEPLIHLEGEPHDRRPVLGYAMVWTAALIFAVNGTVSKVLLDSAGLSTVDLTEARSIGAFVGFALFLAVVRPATFRIGRSELLYLAVFGVAGVALIQWLYFVAIHRLPIGIALLIEYLAPLIIALWARYVFHERVRRRIWVALALALAGLSLIVEVWSGGGALDGLGVLAALAGAGAYALYVLMADHAVQRRDPISVACYGFLFAAIFWCVVQPPWEFPFEKLDDHVSLLGNLEDVTAPVWLLLGFVIVGGTIVTFGLIVSALRHIAATRVAIVAMLEPVAASVVAWAWLGETLGADQLVGGAVVLAAILIAQTAR